MTFRRLFLAIQLVVFMAAGAVLPRATTVQNATQRPVATSTPQGERVVANRERAVDRATRLRREAHGEASLPVETFAPFVAPSGYVIVASTPRAAAPTLRARFSPHAPRGPPHLG